MLDWFWELILMQYKQAGIRSLPKIDGRVNIVAETKFFVFAPTTSCSVVHCLFLRTRPQKKSERQ